MRSELRNQIKKNFTTIPNALISDTSISPQARCLYCLLASKPEKWEFYNNSLAKEMGCSLDSLRKYFKELSNAGWIQIITQKDRGKVNGRFQPNSYVIHLAKATVKKQ